MSHVPKQNIFIPRPLRSDLSIDRLYTAMIRDFGSNFVFQGESHDMWEMSCILSGAAGFTAGTEIFECRQGDAVIIPGNLFHTSWAMNKENVQLLTVSFTGEWLYRFIPTGKFTLTPRENRILQLLAESVREFCSDRDPCVAEMKAEDEQILKNLLEALVLSLNLRRNESEQKAVGTNSDRFSEIAEYMKEHIREPLDVNRICLDCGIGRSVLKELFHRYTGAGVIKYYNYLRVRHIIRLLGEGKTMAEIAELMNFSSQNYLSSFFKRETGMTARQYRSEKLIFPSLS